MTADTTVRVLAASVVVISLFLPPIFAVGVAIAGISLVFLRKIADLSPLLAGVWILAYTLGPWAVDAYLRPVPLARVTVVSDQGTVGGALVTQNGDRVVVARGGGALTTIPANRIRTATVAKPPKRSKPKSVISRVFN